MRHIGDAARELRETIGLSQRFAAEQLGITDVHLCNIEKNRAMPSPALLKRYQELWGIDLYVFAWCQTGREENLPKSVRDAAKRLRAAWEQHIDKVLVSNRSKTTSE